MIYTDLIGIDEIFIPTKNKEKFTTLDTEEQKKITYTRDIPQH